MKKRAFGKLYKDLFYIPKHEKLPNKVFRFRMAVSLLTILACTVVMVASSFALFYIEVSTDNSTIASAYYSVTVDKSENGTYICPLEYEDKHTFEIKADGTATTGYCKIQVGEQIYYTEQIPQGTSLFLTIQAAKDTVITFTPQWGTSSYFNEDTCGNEIIHSATPYAVYEVEPTAKLVNIAVHYGVSEVDILTYNGIAGIALLDVSTDNSTAELVEGTELKIPGVSHDIAPYVAPVSEQMEGESFSENESASSDDSNTEELHKDSTEVIEATEATDATEESSATEEEEETTASLDESTSSETSESTTAE